MSCRNLIPLLFVVLLLWTTMSTKCTKKAAMHVGFYNVENLFDTLDDPNKRDEYFTPSGPVKWTSERYQTKLTNLSVIINQMAEGKAPAILGLCEVENRRVLEDLVAQELLMDEAYEIIHVESEDERGIDNALFYQKESYTPFEHGVEQIDLGAYSDKTRDILWVKGLLPNADTLIVMVNHWPSRSGGKEGSEPKRLLAAKTLRVLVDQMERTHPNAAILILGDFNDEPTDRSLRYVLEAATTKEEGELFNLTGRLDSMGSGTYCYRGNWNMLDQIIVNEKLYDGSGIDADPTRTGIKSEPWMVQTDSNYFGYPLRTYGGRKYLGGYSDHFPVYTTLVLR